MFNATVSKNQIVRASKAAAIPAIETGAATALGPEAIHFSPTDLLAVALINCSLVTMSQAAEKAGASIDGSTAKFDKKMASGPRRVGSIAAEFEITGRPTSEQIAVIERAARDCPVHKSLAPEIQISYVFKYI